MSDYYKIPCPHCHVHVEFPRELLGTVSECPQCGLSVALNIPNLDPKPTPPSAPSGTRMLCPGCGKPVSKQANACPSCGHTFKAPGALDLSDPVHVIGIALCAIVLFAAIVYMIVVLGG